LINNGRCEETFRRNQPLWPPEAAPPSSNGWNASRVSRFSIWNKRESSMKIALLGAALLAAALASPAGAQEVIYNPGYCAQFYPNANCQNKGPGNPYTGSYRRGGWHNGYAWMGSRSWRHRHRHHRGY
jgi:hypothetical protein